MKVPVVGFQIFTCPVVGNNVNEDLAKVISLYHASLDQDLCEWHYCSKRFALTSVTSGLEKIMFNFASMLDKTDANQILQPLWLRYKFLASLR